MALPLRAVLLADLGLPFISFVRAFMRSTDGSTVGSTMGEAVGVRRRECLLRLVLRAGKNAKNSGSSALQAPIVVAPCAKGGRSKVRPSSVIRSFSYRGNFRTEEVCSGVLVLPFPLSRALINRIEIFQRSLASCGLDEKTSVKLKNHSVQPFREATNQPTMASEWACVVEHHLFQQTKDSTNNSALLHR